MRWISWRGAAAWILAATIGISGVVADDESFKSGPPAGKELPGPIQAWMILGKRVNRYHCPVCEYGLNPAVLIFAREVEEADKPIGQLLKKIDASITAHPDARMGCTLVYLEDGGFREVVDNEAENLAKQLADAAKIRDEVQDKLLKLAADAELKNVQMGLFAKEGPKNYELAEMAQYTILVCNRQQVLANYAFAADHLTEKDVDRIAGEVERLAVRVEKLSRPRKR
jgi:hypothetical protein